jgi:prepilin-type N-terminal cleavage/methylation domain-containing protein
MRRQQQGFTLIEIVIAFTILALATVVVAQSSTRAARVDEHFVAMDTLETAVAVVRGELALRQARESYQGTRSDGYRWVAQVLGPASPAAANTRQYLNLYRVRLQVFDDSDRPSIELVTIVPDR